MVDKSALAGTNQNGDFETWLGNRRLSFRRGRRRPDVRSVGAFALIGCSFHLVLSFASGPRRLHQFQESRMNTGNNDIYVCRSATLAEPLMPRIPPVLGRKPPAPRGPLSIDVDPGAPSPRHLQGQSWPTLRAHDQVR